MRISLGPYRVAKNGGFLHRVDRELRPVALKPETLPVPSTELARMAAAWSGAADDARVGRLAADLGVTMPSRRRLDTGWSFEHRAWTFPMRDTSGKVVGIRLRAWSGKKWAVRGGHEGLFAPGGLPADGPLFICEGVTDTAAALDVLHADRRRAQHGAGATIR